MENEVFENKISEANAPEIQKAEISELPEEELHDNLSQRGCVEAAIETNLGSSEETNDVILKMYNHEPQAVEDSSRSID